MESSEALGDLAFPALHRRVFQVGSGLYNFIDFISILLDGNIARSPQRGQHIENQGQKDQINIGRPIMLFYLR